MLDHMLTIHVRSRVFPTMDDAAQFVKAIVTLYDVYVESKHQHVLQVSSCAVFSVLIIVFIDHGH